MTGPKISVYIIAFNAEAHLDEVLDSVQEADEVVLVDSGSTDATVEIAEHRGARVIHRPWAGYAKQKAFALSQCTHEWAVNLDADEVLPPGGLQAIRSRVSQGDVDGLYLVHADTFMGELMPGLKRLPFLRVHRVAAARWDESMHVHEHIHVEGKVERFDLTVLHYGYDELESYVDKLNRYAGLKARQRREGGRTLSYFRLLLIAPLMFFKLFVLRGMFMSGWRGFIKARTEAFYFFLTEAKLYEERFRTDRAPHSGTRHPGAGFRSGVDSRRK